MDNTDDLELSDEVRPAPKRAVPPPLPNNVAPPPLPTATAEVRKTKDAIWVTAYHRIVSEWRSSTKRAKLVVASIVAAVFLIGFIFHFASAASKSARSMTLIQFRQQLDSVSTDYAAMISVFGQPDRAWTDTESGVQTRGINSGGPIPVTPTAYSYTYRYLAWKCSDGTIQLKIDDDSTMKTLPSGQVIVRDIVDSPTPL